MKRSHRSFPMACAAAGAVSGKGALIASACDANENVDPAFWNAEALRCRGRISRDRGLGPKRLTSGEGCR